MLRGGVFEEVFVNRDVWWELRVGTRPRANWNVARSLRAFFAYAGCAAYRIEGLGTRSGGRLLSRTE